MGWMIFSSLANGQEIYRWVDEKGTVHFTDDLSRVPEKYQDRIKKEKLPKEPALSASIEEPKELKIQQKPEPGPEYKDILGRGAEWWQAKVKEWNEKFLSAQKNYETAYAAWKAKEKELQESKFKPDSLKRRMKAEMKDIEAKLTEWEKQKDEAKNTLERVLPKQAEEYRADLDWLKINP